MPMPDPATATDGVFYDGDADVAARRRRRRVAGFAADAGAEARA